MKWGRSRKRRFERKHVLGAATHHAIEALESRVLLSITPILSQLPETAGSSPSHIIDVGGNAYFTVSDPAPALYVSDGTAGGTHVLATLGANPVIDGEGASGGFVYFGVQGTTGQLWQTDGTATNTRKLVDFGPSGGAPQLLTDLNGTLFFAQNNQLWKSDGSAAGTAVVTSASSGPIVAPGGLALVNGALICAAGNGLWVTDGTQAGTLRISTVAANDPSFASLGGKVYFAGFDSAHGFELWQSDGTSAGTSLVKDIYPGSNSSGVSQIVNVNGKLFFSAATTGTAGAELWKSDGTAAGTVQVGDVDPFGSALPHSIQNLNGLAAFLAFDGTGTASLFVSDGTAGGTQELIRPVSGSSLLVVGGKAYFEGADSVAGEELWATDGTLAGTARVADINSGPGASLASNFAQVSGRVYFSATDGVHGPELWMSDGTAAGTAMVADINPAPTGNDNAVHPIILGNRLLYSDTTGLWALDNGSTNPIRLTGAMPLESVTAGGTEFFTVGDVFAPGTSLWKTDGTVAGTMMLRAFPQAMGPHTLFAVNGAIYFAGRDSGASDYSLWTSDGTIAGTLPVLTADGSPVYDPRSLGQVGSTVYFDAYDTTGPSGHGYELWKTDGTAAGTVMVRDIVPGSGNSAPAGVAPSGPATLGGALLFAATSPAGTVELYSSDGTASGTVPLTHFGLTPGAAMQTDFNGGASVVVLGGWGYFMAHDGSGVQSLWRTDGTVSGTTPITAIDPGDAYPAMDLTVVGNQLLFKDVHGGFSTENDLWRSDGTAAGTLLLRKFIYDNTSSGFAVGKILDVNGIAYFSAWSAGNGTGQELWRSDGTAGGTMLAADVLSGPGSSHAENLVGAADGTVVFDAVPQPGISAGLYRYTAPTSAPVIPGTLDAAVAGPFEVDLSWAAPVGDVSGYTLEFSLTADFSVISNTRALPPATTSYIDEMLDPASIYYYRVTAYNPAGNSNPITATATTPAASWTPGIIYQVAPTAPWYSATQLTPFRHQVVFKAIDPVLGWSAYRSDGVHAVMLVSGGVDSVSLSDDGKSVRIVQNTTSLRTWISDGTVQGTVLETSPAAAGSVSAGVIPIGAIVIGGKGYYVDTASDGSQQLFVADGTATPPVQLTFIRKDLTLGGAQPHELTAAYGSLYFFAWVEGGSTGSMPALFRSDGTPQGTTVVATLPVDRFQPGNIQAANGKIFFNDGQYLWATDGTPGNIVTLRAFGYSNDPQIVAAFVVNNQFYFATHVYAGQSQSGTLYDGEFWTSDGTTDGTRPVPGLPRLSPVTANSPSQFVVIDGNIWFTADTSAVPGFSKLFHYTPVATVMTLPAPPDSLSATSVYGSEIDLTWTDHSDNEEGFRLERSLSSGFSSIDASFDLPAGTSRFVDSGLVGSSTYYYRVRAFNAAGLSSAATSGPVSTPAAPPHLGAFAATASLATSSVNLTWSDSATSSDHETGVTLQRSTRSDFATIDRSVALAAGTTSFSDATALSQTQYWYRVYSTNVAGSSAPSIFFFRTPLFPPIAPTGLYAGPVSQSEIDLQWVDNSVNETGFVIQRSDGSGSFAQIGQVGVNVTSYADSTALAGVSYSYRVYAIDAGGASAYSNVSDSTTLSLPLTTPVTQLPPFVPVASDSGAAASTVMVVNGKGVFKAQDSSSSPATGQLWATDGTATGTTLLASYPANAVAMLNVAGGYVYYTVGSGITGQVSLWRTDGTAAGVAKVADLWTVPSGGFFPIIRSPIGYHNRLYYAVQFDSGPYKLFVADSTGVQNIGSFSSFPSNYTIYNDTLYFQANGLMKTDGTVAGTVSTTDFVPGIGLPRVTYGGTTLYTDISALYSNDGTPGGTSVVFTEPGGAGITMLTPVAGGVAFMAKNNQIYFSNGTTAGTVLLTTAAHPILSMAAVGNELYFTLPNSYFELWKSDLTPAGTSFVTSMTFGITGISGVNGVTTFTGGIDGQVWATDGTDAGTTRITNIGLISTAAFPDWITGSNGAVYYTDSGTYPDGPNAGTSGLWMLSGGAGATPTQLFAGGATYPYDFNGVLYFVGKDAKGRVGLFRADPATGTSSLIYADPNLGRPAILGAANGLLYFVDGSPTSDTRHLYVSDGTAGGTHIIAGARMYAPLLTGLEHPFALSSGYLYYRGSDGALMRTDGTTTIQISTPSYNYQQGARVMTDVNGTLFFTLFGSTVGLYKVAAGDTTATLLSQYTQYQDPWLVNDLTNMNGTLFFAAPQAGAGTVLWKSDGTPGGTVPVYDPLIDANFGVNGGKIFGITNVGGVAFFFADEASAFSQSDTGGSLWKSDGTAAGTVRIRSTAVTEDMQNGNPQLFGLAAGGDFVYSDSQFLWRSDGTLAGTIQIDTIGTASDGTQSTALFLGNMAAVVNGTDVYYSGAIPGGGRNLRIASLAVPTSPPGLSASATQPAGAAAASGVAASPAASATTPIYLSWQKGSAQPSGYVIERSRSSDFSSIEARYFVTAPATSFVDTTAAARVAYFYRIRAVTAGGQSAFTGPAGFAPLADVIQGATTNDAIRLVRDADLAHIDWTMGSVSGRVLLNDPAGLTFNGNGGNDLITLDFSNGNPLPGIIHFNGNFTLTGLANPGALNGINLEIGRSTLYFSYTDAQSAAQLIRQSLANGYNGGVWNGLATASIGAITSSAVSGISSAFGIGYADSADGFVTGQTGNTIEVRFTVKGDANLDGVVNSTDAIQMARNFNVATGARWDRGDFNYDGAINLSDATLLQKNFNAVLPSPTQAAVATAAPGMSAATGGQFGSGSTAAVTNGIVPVTATVEPVAVANSAPLTTPSNTSTAAGKAISTPSAPIVAHIATRDLVAGSVKVVSPSGVPRSSTVAAKPVGVPAVSSQSAAKPVSARALTSPTAAIAPSQATAPATSTAEKSITNKIATTPGAQSTSASSKPASKATVNGAVFSSISIAGTPAVSTTPSAYEDQNGDSVLARGSEKKNHSKQPHRATRGHERK